MQRPGFTAEFGAKRVYPSEQGLHIECYTEAQAQAAYAEARSLPNPSEWLRRVIVEAARQELIS